MDPNDCTGWEYGWARGTGRMATASKTEVTGSGGGGEGGGLAFIAYSRIKKEFRVL